MQSVRSMHLVEFAGGGLDALRHHLDWLNGKPVCGRCCELLQQDEVDTAAELESLFPLCCYCEHMCSKDD